MDMPPIATARAVAPDTDALTAHLPVPGLGVLPANAFLIRSSRPVLVDAGVVAQAEAFFDALCRLIDPADLRWIWLTHTDADHTGCLDRVLQAAPRARLVTTFLGLGKLGLRAPVPADRVLLLNPGQSLDAGDRRLRCLRPPTYDAPETTAVFDERSRTYFSADCFGAVLDAPAECARDVDPSTLREGMVTWAGIDAPWLTQTDPEAFERELQGVLAMQPQTVLAGHLPPAPAMAADLVRNLRAVPGTVPAPAPDQEAFERMLISS